MDRTWQRLYGLAKTVTRLKVCLWFLYGNFWRKNVFPLLCDGWLFNENHWNGTIVDTSEIFQQRFWLKYLFCYDQKYLLLTVVCLNMVYFYVKILFITPVYYDCRTSSLWTTRGVRRTNSKITTSSWDTLYTN